MSPRTSVSVSPNPVQFGALLTASAPWNRTETPWFHSTGYDTTDPGKDLEQYVKGTLSGGTAKGILTIGPTPSWESGAGTGTVEVGYWRQGTRWVALATTDFEVAG